MTEREDLKVVAAAIIGEDGVVYSLPPPARHHDIIHHLAEVVGHSTPISGEQGFVLNDGSFARRARAKWIAQQAGQLLPRASKSDHLFSEDVW